MICIRRLMLSSKRPIIRVGSVESASAVETSFIVVCVGVARVGLIHVWEFARNVTGSPSAAPRLCSWGEVECQRVMQG